MNNRYHIAIYTAAALATGLLAGCFSAKPDQSQFYVLSALPASAAPQTPPAGNVAIGVYSPELPTYLAQPQIVASAGENQVTLNEYQRWAEPVTAGFSRVLVQDIALLAGTDKVALFPLTRTFGQEFEVYVLVFQFDGVPGGNVTLHASWRITGAGGKPNFVVQDSTFTESSTASASSYTGYVATLSKLVGDLAQAIVASLPQARASEADHQAAEAKAEADKQAADAAEEVAMAAQVAAAKPPPAPTPPTPAPTPADATAPATPVPATPATATQP